ncbi:G-type lectin S-receptor-like serine/threonine-protein kinase At4g03230 [Malus sylvestris]|uniref:G-type lectin S-receptor-like serine/threonine-protein kinase At4g03230 n=1 Tax=Malus sylvestris TaxID=3752 RepID=UPI0021AC98A6|nr:G-type lectin S-receptor-like serine/threonine-protein kinase At4g03230 [Malus sylvestris]
MMFLRGRLTRSNYVIASFVNRMLFYIFVSYAAVFLCSSHPFCCARDTITYGAPITDGVESGTLVSSGGRFELGFFSPSLNGTQRYVGIWYHQLSPRTVVWVANRETPVLNSTSTGFLALRDGNLQVLDTTGKSYWSTTAETSESLTQTVTLMDSGNLVLSSGDDKLAVNILWQSFQRPTDTFIPGMVLDKSLELTSWRGEDDPAKGKFIFKQDQVGENQYVISKSESILYWKGGEPATDAFYSFDQMLPAVTYLLSNFSKKYVVRNSPKIFSSPSQNSTYKNITIPPRSEYDYTRLVISVAGEIQFWTWINSTKQWNLYWYAPRDECSVFNACGNFGSCNSNNRPLLCKCLPGFKPQYLQQWNSGDFSGGCTREYALCGDDKNDTFLSLKKMKVGNPDLGINVDNETECRNMCLTSCQCNAYSYANFSQRRDAPPSLCRIWDSVNNLEEEYTDRGQDLSVRVVLSDLGILPLKLPETNK